MASFDSLTIRGLSQDDLADAVALSAEAGWNQTADDWRLLIEGGRTFGVETAEGTLVASALAYVYEDRVAWIAMVLVTAAWQRRGIATELMRRAVAQCQTENFITGLDATPAGREVYLPLGFEDVYRFTRFEASAVLAGSGTSACAAMQAEDLDDVVAYDRAVSGRDRRALIEDLWRRQPGNAFTTRQNCKISGIALARDGRLAQQLGPISADDSATAATLAAAALDSAQDIVFIDVLDDKPDLHAHLRKAGFVEQRSYIRMLLGRDEPLDDTARAYVVTGPEFG